jgi:hypothetical protein
MAKTCTACGSPLKENAKFCEVCGSPVAAKSLAPERFCVQCGNLLKPGTKFCEVCGREVEQPKQKEEPQIKEPTTMEELVIPEITEDTFGSARELHAEKFDGFEAAVMPDSQPEQPAAPAPAPEFSMDTAAVAEKPKAAVKVKAAPKPAAAQTAQPQTNPTQAQPQQNTYQPGAPIPTVMADGKLKTGLKLVQIILIVLIVLVLIVDAVVFIGKGKKNDNAGSENNVLVVTDNADYGNAAAIFSD